MIDLPLGFRSTRQYRVTLGHKVGTQLCKVGQTIEKPQGLSGKTMRWGESEAEGFSEGKLEGIQALPKEKFFRQPLGFSTVCQTLVS